MSSFHIDAGFAATLWFDVDTQLVTAIGTQTLGPMAEGSIRWFQFEFDKKPVVKVDLSLTPGYKRVH